MFMCAAPRLDSSNSFFLAFRDNFNLERWGGGRERERGGKSEVVNKVHDPLVLTLFELVALPVPDALCVLCRRQKSEDELT